jgi:hypothetical protein
LQCWICSASLSAGTPLIALSLSGLAISVCYRINTGFQSSKIPFR